MFSSGLRGYRTQRDRPSFGSPALANRHSLRASSMPAVIAFVTAANMRRVICAIEVSIFAGQVTGTTLKRIIWQPFRRSPKASTKKRGYFICIEAITLNGFATALKIRISQIRWNASNGEGIFDPRRLESWCGVSSNLDILGPNSVAPSLREAKSFCGPPRWSRTTRIRRFTFTVCASWCILKERRVGGANQEKGGQTMTDGGSSLHGDQGESAEPPSSSSGLN